jgi:FkbM family methyltransferase
MIEKIRRISKLESIDLKYLKNSKLPLLLYGAKKFASMVKKYLDKENIRVDYVAVRKDFYTPNEFLDNIPVKILDEVIDEQLSVNIVFGFFNYKDEMARLSSYKNISKTIFIDCSGFSGFDQGFIETYYSMLEKLYYRLEDTFSREIMLAFIESKRTLCPDALYKLNVKDEKQYFPSFLQLKENEVFVDCGAYDGDTALTFDQIIHNYTIGGSKIYAFECDKANVKKLWKNTAHLENIKIIEKGCWSEKGTLFFSNEGTTGSLISDKGQLEIEVDSIDNAVQDEVSFIKMDIEGAELEALKGAKNTISKYKPKLAISVYHKQEDLITIPQYILQLNDNYKLYLRHYGEISIETILYAI